MASGHLRYQEAAVKKAEALYADLKSDARGLSKKDRQTRLAEVGPNEIGSDSKSGWTIFLRQLKSPFIYLLFGAAAISIYTEDLENAGMIFLFMVINTGLGFFQEYRAEEAVKLLKKYWQTSVHVLQEGKPELVPTRELVPGDVVRLQAGDKIPADVRFMTTTNVTIDESILTGESVTVGKDSHPMTEQPKDYYKAANIGFFGTSMLTGDAEALVIATGKNAALGEIAKLTTETKSESAFERQIADFSKFILKLVIGTLAVVFALNIAIKGVSRVQEFLLFAIALTVGVIPEALPVVATVALSSGAQRMAKKKVVVKRLSAINDLGSIDVLCTDKTGTVTQNVLKVSAVKAADHDECLRLAILGSSFLGEKKKQANNAFDIAIWKYATVDLQTHTKRVKKIGELPFDPVRRRNSVLMETPEDGQLMIVRGSPEDLLPLCKNMKLEQLRPYLEEQGRGGNRVIAVAVKRGVTSAESLADEEKDLDYVGLISFLDPLKPDAAASAVRAKKLGVQIKILTGDSKAVAGAVALQMKLIDDPTKTISGAEFDALSQEEKHEAVHKFHVFARVNPQQKFAVLGLLKEKYTVGFLGEGFNDAPGLKMAHAAIAVEGASDIAKDAADVILLGKSLMVIFDGIEEGRRVFTNIIKYLKVTLGSNFGNFYSVAIASLFIDFLPMLPLQILLVNLLTDFPMIAIAGDSVDISELKKPKKYEAKDIILTATILGVVSSVFDFMMFAVFMRLGEGPLQTLWFIGSNLTELALIYSLRTNGPFWKGAKVPLSIAGLTVGAAIMTFVIPMTDWGRRFFKFVKPEPWQLLLIFAIVGMYFVSTEIVKHWLQKEHKEKPLMRRKRKEA